VNVSQEESCFFDGFVAVYLVFAVVSFVPILNCKNRIIFQVWKIAQILTVVAKYLNQGADVVRFGID
jgi:hypothetical protein